MRRSRSDRKKLGHVGSIRKFWRRYHLTKIVIILGLSSGLLVGTYLFAIAKSTNVNDLQNALKTRTLIFDREEKRGRGSIRSKGEPMLSWRISAKTCKMLLSRQRTVLL